MSDLVLCYLIYWRIPETDLPTLRAVYISFCAEGSTGLDSSERVISISMQAVCEQS